MAEITSIEILQAIQTELKAPKSQFNKFGGYPYRNCEDILEAVKPIAAKHKSAVLCADELVLVGDRYYIKATATLKTPKGNESTTAYAREPQDKKGMDESQITGSTSSYARKYALNGLFAIDDTKDADTLNTGDAPKETPKSAKTTPAAPKVAESGTKEPKAPAAKAEKVITPLQRRVNDLCKKIEAQTGIPAKTVYKSATTDAGLEPPIAEGDLTIVIARLEEIEKSANLKSKTETIDVPDVALN